MAIEGLVWHGLGIICVVGLLRLAMRIFKNSRQFKWWRTGLYGFLGLLFGVLGVIMLLLLFILVGDWLWWLTEIHFTLRLSLVAFFHILSAWAAGIAGAYALRKRVPQSIIINSALMAGLLLILQPIAYGWFKWVWGLVG